MHCSFPCTLHNSEKASDSGPETPADTDFRRMALLSDGMVVVVVVVMVALVVAMDLQVAYKGPTNGLQVAYNLQVAYKWPSKGYNHALGILFMATKAPYAKTRFPTCKPPSTPPGALHGATTPPLLCEAVPLQLRPS